MIYRFAGYVGILPETLTLRQLWLMVEGKMRRSWEVASAQMMVMHNTQCDKKSRVGPQYYNPMTLASRGGERELKVGDVKTNDLTLLKCFVPNRGKE